MTAKTIADTILFQIHETTARAMERYLPGLRLPGYFAGHRVTQDYAVDLCVVLTLLHQAGYTSIGGRSIIDSIRTIFAQLDGSTIKIFYSYRVAETLLALGGLENNPLLEGLPLGQVNQLKRATDTTNIFDPATGMLRGLPNNYWCVLARCEHSRSRLGLIEDDAIYRASIERTRELLFRNPAGFFDDDVRFNGRFDIYTADVMLFVEPMWDLLGRDRIMTLLADHVRLLEAIAMPNGASVCWGRSIGALSVCMTAELATAGLHHGLGRPDRLLNLVSNAFDHFMTDWMRDDLIQAHSGRMTDAYRGPARLMQMTFDCLQKLIWAALQLREIDRSNETLTRSELFPPRDELIHFESRPAGIWMYRDRAMEFQLPIVNGYNADYATAPHAPGLFDTPVDSPIFVGVPRVIAHGKEYSTLGLPTQLAHAAGRLSIEGLPIKLMGSPDDSAPASIGTRDASWSVKHGTLIIDERWTFDCAPAAISYAIAECDTPMTVEWSTSSGHSATVVNVDGMHGFATAWSGVKRLHQINLAPVAVQQVTLRVTITPAIKVAHGPGKHDYNRGIYDRMPAGRIVEMPWESGIAIDGIDAFVNNAEQAGILHMGWPEHLIALSNPKDEIIAANARLIDDLKRRGVKIVWTMHNRRPHSWPAAEGRALYRLWASAADALLHHSEWGKSIMLADYAFRADCIHAIVPHGHFGHQMKTDRSRGELEAKYGLMPCAIRFGVLGRYQPEKQIELMLQAFNKAGRPDQQLLLTAYDDKTAIPDDPRIIKLPRKSWLTREEIAEHNALCDGLIAAQTGDTYLTSGMVGDGVAMGSAMIVQEWAFYREILGDAALYHENTVDSLAALLAGVTTEQIEHCRDASRTLQATYDWANLSPRILEVFRQLLS